MTASKRLGKYEILEEIGRGGFAVVYKARDTTLNRIVALKVLHPQLTIDPKFVQRFHQEARTAAGLHHFHIVTIYEVGEEAGQHYLAMAFLPGRTLDQRLIATHGPLPVELAISIVEQIADALDTIHQQGLVHRDVKPANIMVDGQGQATLLDFGIVRAAEGTRLTTTMAILGTPEYMAPEQADPLMGEVDWRADIYALGVVAYEMLVGQPPFTGKSPTRVLYQHVHEPPPAPTTLNASLPDGLEPVLLKVLAKGREERFQQAGDFAATLRRTLSTESEIRRREAQLVPLYKRLQDAAAGKNWPEVLALGSQIQALDASYRDVSQRMAHARQQLHWPRREPAQPPPAQPAKTPKQGISRRRLLQGALIVSGSVVGCGAAATVAALVAAQAWPSCPGPQEPTRTPKPTSIPTETPSPTDTPAPTLEPADIAIMYSAIGDTQIAQFNADYAPITLERIDWDRGKYSTMVAAGNPPDLLYTPSGDFPNYLAHGIPLNLQSYFEASTVLKLDDLMAVNDYYRATGPTNVGEGDRYGVVTFWGPDYFLWVDERRIAEAGLESPDPTQPMTEDYLADLCRAATSTWEGEYWLTGLGMRVGTFTHYWMALIKAAGGSLFSDDFRRANIVGNDAAEDAIAYLFALAADGALQSPINSSASWCWDDFIAGRLAMLWAGFWVYPFFIASSDGAFQQDMTDGTIKMHPNFTWRGTRHNPCAVTYGVIVSASSKYPDHAWVVFEWLAGKEPAQELAKTGFYLPALKSLYDLVPKEVLSSQMWETLQDELPYSEDILKFNPYLGDGVSLVPSETFEEYWGSALKGEITLDEMLQQIESATNAAIQEGMAS
jgi:serine/threonine protein kinase